ncbi:MAG TPA: isocitrate lyase/phosphoenolpyruvate mutase family protein, partial [Terriglobales bacterium]|nr:isocitrate lyase/phosphoenolpyruvate mutase family protein [Terriglobales bacterium]
MKSKTLKTRTFRDLHGNSKKPLILPSVWDVAGALLVESLGAKAVATTSAGVAWSLGYPDGNYMPARLQARLSGRDRQRGEGACIGRFRGRLFEPAR